MSDNMALNEEVLTNGQKPSGEKREAFVPSVLEGIKYIDARGTFVKETDEKVAYTVNTNDPDWMNFVERVRKEAKNTAPISDEFEEDEPIVVQVVEIELPLSKINFNDKRTKDALIEAGYDTYQKIVEADKSKLVELKFVTENNVDGIQEQALEALAAQDEDDQQ